MCGSVCESDKRCTPRKALVAQRRESGAGSRKGEQTRPRSLLAPITSLLSPPHGTCRARLHMWRVGGAWHVQGNLKGGFVTTEGRTSAWSLHREEKEGGRRREGGALLHRGVRPCSGLRARRGGEEQAGREREREQRGRGWAAPPHPTPHPPTPHPDPPLQAGGQVGWGGGGEERARLPSRSRSVALSTGESDHPAASPFFPRTRTHAHAHAHTAHTQWHTLPAGGDYAGP